MKKNGYLAFAKHTTQKSLDCPRLNQETFFSRVNKTQKILKRNRDLEKVSPERMRSSVISASPRKAAACSGVRFSGSFRDTKSGLHSQKVANLLQRWAAAVVFITAITHKLTARFISIHSMSPQNI